jgi:hypothetical protein
VKAVYLNLALDRHLRNVVIKVIPEENLELEILKILSSVPLRSDPRNHTIPVLQFISGAGVEFVVQAHWCEHWDWPPFDCFESRLKMALQLLEVRPPL